MEQAVLVAQLCLTLCDPMDYSPPGSFVHGILQTSILEWVAIPFSRGSSQPRDWTRVFCIAGRLFTLWVTKETLQCLEISYFIKKITYLYICLYWDLVVAGGIFSCGMWTLSCSTWDLVPWSGIESRPPAWGAWSLSHWTTREVHGDILECHMRDGVKSIRQRPETHPNILPCTG